MTRYASQDTFPPFLCIIMAKGVYGMKKAHIILVVVLALFVGMFGGVAFANSADNITLWINGQRLDWRDPKPPVMIDGSIYVPLRAVSETLGASVEWDGARNTALIAGYRDPDTIVIEGPEGFKKDMRDAIELLREKDPDGYKLVGQYVKKIWLDDTIPYTLCNSLPMWIRISADQYAVSERSSKQDRVYWWAGILVHEATHAEQGYEARNQDRDRDETEAYTRQIETFSKVGAPQIFIDDTKRVIRDKDWKSLN